MARILVIFLLGMAVAPFALAADAELLTVKKHLTRQQFEDTVTGKYEMECPPGYQIASSSINPNFPGGFDIVNTPSTLFGVEFKSSTGGSLDAIEVTVSLPITGWTSVDLFIICRKPTPAATVVQSTSTAQPGASTVSGAATCPAGTVAVGGTSSMAGGEVKEETANVNVADPFNLHPVNGEPILWDAFGLCITAGCSLKLTAVCAQQSETDLVFGKRLPVDPAEPSRAVATGMAKAVVAANSVGTVSVACPAGKFATGAGYVASNPLQTTLVSISPDTPGTPYGARPDGIYEAPTGFTLTMINSASTSNQIGVTAICNKVKDAVMVVEFYNASLDHYFITWLPQEIAILDAGTQIRGWMRTSYSFKTYTTPRSGTSPVCRYYIPPGLGDSHFFGRGTVECNATGQKFPSFVLEDPIFMHMFLPASGVCPANTTEVYRAFDNRTDANHRYMTDRAVRDQMVAQGWIAEGDGPNLVVMCAPQ
jgi:hypothetical protein